MTSAEIRQRFIDYFVRQGHRHVASSSLVPRNDPTLLFTNAGMVQFKRAFLGEEKPGYTRAVTSQKCLRVSGKHNDLEEVGVTTRHHTFFEMLGNFSFGDYFKRDAIRFAWELFTEEYVLPAERLWVTVHHSDDEAAKLWQEVAGVAPNRIFKLGDKDNFWQMGETGPCGPCSEIHYDLRPAPDGGTDVTLNQFIEYGQSGQFLELWNLVFMQFDRAADGMLTPLPAPSIDTGAGLERVTSVLQGVDSNYKTDLFVALIERGAQVVGKPYTAESSSGVSYRVLADHARAVAFLLADGVLPSNEGQGYVVRRILRRAVRHAWLLGRREPTLVHVAERVIDLMGDAYPELRHHRDMILSATREEEQRFLDTIDSGMERISEIAPELSSDRRYAIETGDAAPPVISGEDAFRLHDTFGFPLDLTELIAQERGYRVDVAGFERALEAQRARSRADRKAAGGAGVDVLAEGWKELDSEAVQQFVGYDSIDVSTDVIALRREDGRAALILRNNPFYIEAGGQVSDSGSVEGDGWQMRVEEVRRVGGRVALIGQVQGSLSDTAAPLRVRAVVERRTRHDTVRNHTATHLLHAALRNVLGTHVVQRGSLVAPDRLRFDFAHPRPMTPDELRRVEDEVNEGILEDHNVVIQQMPQSEAIGRGAMALFGEKYGDVVRVVSIPGVSMELCGGTHARHTGEIGLFRIVSETGVAAGVRRIEAVTGTEAYRRAVETDATLERAAALVRTTPDSLIRRLEQVAEENRELRRRLEKARQTGGSDRVTELLASATSVDGMRVIASSVDAEGPDELRALGDKLREKLGSGAAVLAAAQEGRVSLLCVVTDDLPGRGVKANELIREIATAAGGSGGGKAHMAQGGAGDAARVEEALKRTADIVRTLISSRG